MSDNTFRTVIPAQQGYFRLAAFDDPDKGEMDFEAKAVLAWVIWGQETKSPYLGFENAHAIPVTSDYWDTPDENYAILRPDGVVEANETIYRNTTEWLADANRLERQRIARAEAKAAKAKA
jgi:hypothetical protein